jgi:excisionase family DNA binding protein
MTRDEVLALPVTIDLLTTAKALGISRSMAYEMARSGTYPIALYRVGQRYRATRADLMEALGISDNAPATVQPAVAVPASRPNAALPLRAHSMPADEQRRTGAWDAAA